MASLSFEGVGKSFGAKRALEGVSLEIADGEFFALLGETGAGKTTSLRLMAGLERPDSGRILFDGADVAAAGPAERDVALVLQQYSLYPRLTVRENLAFPLNSPLRRIPKAEAAQRLAEAARLLRIEPLLDRKPDRLSGGEMQRVSIGRAIVRRPRLFLMDEPLSALDAKLREELRAELKALHQRLGATFVFVTHDQVEAMSMAGRIGVLKAGRLLQVGSPQEIYARPVNTAVAAAVGAPPINLPPGFLREGRAFLEGPGKPVFIGLRPEALIFEAGAPHEAEVAHVEDHGVNQVVRLTMGETILHALAPPALALRRGERARFGWPAAAEMIFDRETGLNLAPASA